MTDYKATIRELMTHDDLLDCVMEECAELIQACSKWKRAKFGSTNPTPVKLHEAIGMVQEEVHDLLLVLDVMGLVDTEQDDNPKLERWAKRLLDKDMTEVKQ